MIIQHNIISEFGNRTLKSNNKRLGKSGEKLSGGYAINRAADNVAGLAISEKMRGQIRGLNRAKENIQEGIEYVKNADGAMNEITGMVQRMRELTVQALNDTNTKEDKEQIQLEITQLQNEIDRMVNHTEYNTKDIFDKHEPIYDSLLGNRNWDVDQVHEVYTPDNYLNIRLAPEYNPSEITVQVSEGNYTTYELLETIEDQLEGKAPDGTSLLIEYYKGGTCNLTFENGTEIENVDGGLAYLFYDCYGGAGIGDLIGTTEFAEQYPLSIVKGKNDELTFFIDKMDGSTPKKISIILDASKYTREEMIEAINTKLKNASHTEVSAIAYGDSNIKLSAGTSLITGLKGNMFQIDESKTAYDSVFYDNAKYGVVTSTAGKITGKAYYNSTCDKIVIDSTNNVLKIALQKDIVSGAGYTTITIPEKAEGYTIKELATVLNTQLVAISANDKWNFTTSNSYVSTSVLPSSGYYDCLQLTSLIEGNESKIVVDTGDAVSSAAYNALFKTTTLTSQKTPYIQTYGTDVYTKGYKTHNGEIDLQTAGKTLNISVNGGAAETITLSKAKYDSIDSLLDDIQKQIDASSRLAGKVVATKADGQNKIMLTSDNQDVTKINIITGTAYSELFTSKEPDYYSYTSSTAYGTTEKSQGSTVMVQTPATITLMYPMTTDNIVVDGTNNKLTLTVDGKNKTIILPNGTYTRAQLIQTLNLQFSQNGIGVTAKLNSQNKVQFTTNSAGDNASLFISTYSSNVATKVLMTPTIVTKTGSSSYKSPASIEGRKTITSNFTIDSSNKDFTFTYKEKSGSTWKDTLVDISLTEGAYTSPIDLVTALNKKIEEKLGSDKVVASLNSSKCIVIETVESGASYGLTVSNKNTSGGIVYGGGFYQNVLCDKTLQTKTNTPTNVSGGCMVGTSSLTDANINMAYVVGRADLKNETVEIKANVNDVLSLDFSYPKDTKTTETITLETKIPVGTHTGEEIVAILEEGLNKQLKEVYGITNFVIKPEIGNINTGVVGSNDNNALNFKLKWNKETTPVEGTYILDGVSGNAAYTVFYKTSGLPKPASITGTKDISGGVTITPETNTFGFTIDEKEYDFTLPEGEYTEEEFITMLNNLFASGDEDGDIPKLEAVLENGLLKLQYAIYGEHTIFDIRGTAKDILFFGKDGRDIAERMRLQIGANAGQELTLYKIPLSSALMKIDTLLVTNHSYAQYALKHLDYALNYINNQRSIYGAKNNRLEHAEQLATIEEEQMQTAESKIRDTDMADEIMRYSKEQILAQASQAMVAQSNSLYKDGVLKLLV